jgi:hypothetical protein
MLRRIGILVALATVPCPIVPALALICVAPVAATAQTKRVDPFVQAERDLEAARSASRHDRADRVEELEQRQRHHELVSPLADDDEAKEADEEELD